MSYLFVAAGGALGAAVRHWVVLRMLDWFGEWLPWGTLFVNVCGSFLIGLLATLALETGRLSAHQRQFVLPGLLGGFTTYSAFSFETQRYLDRGDYGHAALYVTLTLAGGLAGVLLGVALARAVD
ncbi:MAG: fluoride efflux transporter CrcB [Dehalococcoidia bacterium]